MYPSNLLISGLLCHLAAAQVPAPRPMVLCDSKDTAEPTWRLTMTPEAHQGSFWRYVLLEAQGCWEWAMDQPKHFGKDGNDALVVSMART